MNQPKIIAYMKPSCGWSNGVRAVLKKYDLAYEDRDIINDAANYQEMVQKSGQPLQPTLDIDGSVTATKYDALTDGLLAIRYMFGLTGSSLTAGALGGTATRNDPVTIKTYLDANRSVYDIDGDANVDALTDGLLILRYLFGLRGSSLVQGAIAAGAVRNTAAQIESYLATLTP